MNVLNEDGWLIGDPVKTPNRNVESGWSFGYIKETKRKSCLVWYGTYGIVVDNKRLTRLAEGESVPDTIEKPTRKAPEEPTKSKKEAVPAGEKQPKAPKTLHPEVQAAKEVYDGALVRLSTAIEASQKAREALSADKENADLKTKVTEARAEHQAALVHIKDVRPKYHALRDKHKASTPAAKAEETKEG